MYQLEIWKWMTENIDEKHVVIYRMWLDKVNKIKRGEWKPDEMFVHSTLDYVNEKIDTTYVKFEPSRAMLDMLKTKNKPRKKQTRGRRKEAPNQPQCKCKHFNYEHFKGKCKECGCEKFGLDTNK